MSVVPITCLAYGNEAACPLCTMVNWDHPVTVASFGPPAYGYHADAADAAVQAQYDRAWNYRERP